MHIEREGESHPGADMIWFLQNHREMILGMKTYSIHLI